MLGAVAGVAYLGYSALQALRAPGAGLLDSVNPVSPDNVVYRAVSTAVEDITGDKGATLGTWIYDVSHPAYEPNAKPVPAPVPAPVKDGIFGWGWWGL